MNRLLSRTYPETIERWWMEEAVRREGADSDEQLLERMESAVSALSDGFTTDRARGFGGYADDPRAWLAYGLFYFPQTFMRIRWILQEAMARHPISPTPPEGLRILDLGAGTGAASAAALSALRTTTAAPVRLTLVDSSRAALELAQSIFATHPLGHADISVSCQAADLRLALPSLEGPWDLILISYALNEAFAGTPDGPLRRWWEQLAGRLAPDGMLIVCEPLVRETGPFMLSLRQWALDPSMGLHVLAPCLHEEDCPLPAAQSAATLSCHDVRHWRVPGSMQFLNRRLFRGIHDLKFSFLALSRHPQVSGEYSARLVSPLLREKGRWRCAACFADGVLRRCEIPQRGLSRTQKDAVDALERGDTVAFTDLTPLKDGRTWRGALRKE